MPPLPGRTVILDEKNSGLKTARTMPQTPSKVKNYLLSAGAIPTSADNVYCITLVQLACLTREPNGLICSQLSAPGPRKNASPRAGTQDSSLALLYSGTPLLRPLPPG